MLDRESILAQTRKVMSRIFRVPADSFNDHTRAADIASWDSLSHLVLITALEKQFDIAIPAGEANAAQNVGELVDLIARLSTGN